MKVTLAQMLQNNGWNKKIPYKMNDLEYYLDLGVYGQFLASNTLSLAEITKLWLRHQN